MPSFIFFMMFASSVLTYGVESQKIQENERLYNTLFRSYNNEVQPMPIMESNSSSTEVQFGLSMMCFEIGGDGILRGNARYNTIWRDERLIFDQSEFKGVKALHVHANTIWLPDIILYNRADSWRPMFPGRQLGFSGDVIIQPDGKVTWVSDNQVEAHCDIAQVNVNDKWAEQNCVLKFGSWSHSANVIELKPSVIDLNGWRSNCPMQVVRVKQVLTTLHYLSLPEPYMTLDFNLTLVRRFEVNDDGIVRNPTLIR